MKRIEHMKKWILLIGLLTFSSLGWSKTLMMECFVDVPPLMKQLTLGLTKDKLSYGIFKMETDEETTSPDLITWRQDGDWKKMFCTTSDCTKGDQSVVVTKDNGEENMKWVFDFRFLKSTLRGKMKDPETGEIKDMDTDMKCETIR